MKTLLILLLKLLTLLVYESGQNMMVSSNITRKKFVYNTYEYDTKINVMVNENMEQILDFYEESGKLQGFPTRVHVSTNDTLDGDYPIFITATQQKGVLSWELPLVVQTPSTKMQFDDMARTLCPHDAGSNITSENRPTIQITTSNPGNVTVDIKLRRVEDFFIEVDKEVSLNVTPSTPKYFYFSFGQDPWNVSFLERPSLFPRFNYTIPKSVILIIESDDDLCAVVSIQNNSCPVFDNEKDVLYQGYHLTMTTKGGITLTQSMFPVGFYVVFIVKQSSEECTGVSETAIADGETAYYEEWEVPTGVNGRTKNFRLRIIATISYKEYVIGALVFLALISLVALSALVVFIPSCKSSEEVVIMADDPGPSSSRIADDDEVPIINDEKISRDGDMSDSEPEVCESMPRALTVAGLSKSRQSAHDRRSNRYFWSALTVAVVYALPVVQLLYTYQHMVFQTGNQDLCYYNFLCAHPLGSLSDFNHVYSNAGYVILGAAFMLQTRARSRARLPDQNLGIPQHYGLFYSMGLALVMEGLLSACYHLCPNKMNFQFDSSFMYVIAVLSMVKLYQNRHPDVNASAHSTFMVLACIMSIGLFGIMYPSVYFWILFTILHLAACFFLTINIYYVGRFKMGWRTPYVACRAARQGGLPALIPTYKPRAILLALANAANWALAAYGLYEHNKDFARHLLAILMGNTILYIWFYIVMKLVHRERIPIYTWIYLVLSHASWALALKLFLDSNTKWSYTPSHSRQYNRVCSALRMFDSHDLWHAASAAALYFSFDTLLTVDDHIQHTPREQIYAF